MLQTNRIEQSKIKDLLLDLLVLLITRLNPKNMTKAINTIPALTFSFGVIKWTLTDKQSIKRFNRTSTTIF